MKKIWFSCIACVSMPALSAPFETCPSQAYLFQSTPVQVYGVNLVTGSTSLLQTDTGIDANINGVGFDFNSRYIFGYNTSDKSIVRLDSDFQAQTLNVSGLPTDYTFYVGDVFNSDYYLYRRNKGMFKIDLSPLDDNDNAQLVLEEITANASVNLTDFAVNPVNNKLYGIDNGNGFLYEFDLETGESTFIGETGETGTFGAGYFDVNGYYYVSRNQDGQVYRIDLTNESIIASGDVPAIKFADGPSSSQNDGARCANAPVIDEDANIDFGDAPDSYLTSLASNGPRHELDGTTWLGESSPDGENDGQIMPLSDDNTGSDDEDGVDFLSSIVSGLGAAIDVNASSSGYLSAWVDWNQDGDFADAGEQIFTDEFLNQGINTLFFTAQADALSGSTWARFRFSQQEGIDYFGGARSGEVEDYQIEVVSEGTTLTYFPTANEAATIAYEDNWPHKADYDMNDVVMQYHITEIHSDNKLSYINIKGALLAYGADYHNGFAVRLAGINKDDINADLTKLYHNNVLQSHNGLESDASEAIFIIAEDLSDSHQSECSYFRTENSCSENLTFSFQLRVALEESADTSSLIAMPYDPFIFATPNYYHGEDVPFQPGRTWEVHLPDQAPTEKFNRDEMWGLGVDASDESTNTYFKTETHLPWAILIPGDWNWPEERVNILTSYPDFATFAESAGTEGQDWYKAANGNLSSTYNQ